MKLSIAWIFDHIKADWRTIDIAELAKKFNATTAEIEKVIHITFDLDTICAAQIMAITDNSIIVSSTEWNDTYQLPSRKDAVKNSWYLIKKNGNTTTWLATSHFGSTKDHLMPAVTISEKEQAGAWKATVEKNDYILEVDNKSITHRPDMWGHRGFAREIAALYNLPLKPLADFIEPLAVEEHTQEAPASKSCPFTVSIEATACSRFAGLYLPQVSSKPSTIKMALRLARVDAKPIDAVVDCTNYTMLTLSQPLHAFDANAINSKKIAPRMAHTDEELTLLDGQKITLTPNDLVIADEHAPLALAGIMGGCATAVTAQTSAVFVEAACFDATTIRRTATRFKLRTEASARFEKTLDPNQNTDALMYFAQLCIQTGVCPSVTSPIVSCGAQQPEITIPLLYQFINDRLGASIDRAFTHDILTQLGFGVDPVDDTVFIVTVPSFRAAKDVSIKEDILEEIGRFYGYTNIVTQLPHKESNPNDTHAVYRRRTIKRTLAIALAMHEIEDYAFFDEDFLRRLNWQPGETLSVQSPVSENWRRLVTTLIPHLFKAVEQNSADYDQLRFFEWARVWHRKHENNTITVDEHKRLVGIFFHKKEPVDFYGAKQKLQQLFDALKLPVSWHQVQQPQDPWFMPYQTAEIKYNSLTIGTFGVINPLFLSSVSDGFACAFELDGDFLLNYQAPQPRYRESSKYPTVERDISVLIAQEETVDSLIQLIKQADAHVVHVELIDCFIKKEWTDKRALTFRLQIQDVTKTLTKDEIEHIYTHVTRLLSDRGATIR